MLSMTTLTLVDITVGAVPAIFSSNLGLKYGHGQVPSLDFLLYFAVKVITLLFLSWVTEAIAFVTLDAF